MLAEADRHQIQWSAGSLIREKPIKGKEKKGANGGIDGVIAFVDDHTGASKRCIVQVKSGHVSSAMIRDLVGVINREKAAMGVLVTLEPDTGPMRKEAAEAGFYHSPGWNASIPASRLRRLMSCSRGVSRRSRAA